MCIVCEDDPLKCPTCLCADDMDPVRDEYYCSKCNTYWYVSVDYDYLVLVKENPNV
jgi:hypothetical protein